MTRPPIRPMSPKTTYIATGVCAFIVGASIVLYRRVMQEKATAEANAPLSPRRQAVLKMVSEVVPSKYGDERFARLAPGYNPNDPKLPKGFTTCGYLPLYIGHELGAKDGISKGGIEGLRTAGKKAGAWVEAGGSKRPRPGDLYGLSATPGGVLTHVGVIIDVPADDPETAPLPMWKTADAGQGAQGALQEAAYFDRLYDTTHATLGGPAGARPLAGWIDIDKYPIGEARVA